jgi:hypothetical protein
MQASNKTGDLANRFARIRTELIPRDRKKLRLCDTNARSWFAQPTALRPMIGCIQAAPWIGFEENPPSMKFFPGTLQTRNAVSGLTR